MKRDTKLTGAPNPGDGLNASHYSKMSIRSDMSLRGKRGNLIPYLRIRGDCFRRCVPRDDAVGSQLDQNMH
jgi:hypothetical protein